MLTRFERLAADRNRAAFRRHTLCSRRNARGTLGQQSAVNVLALIVEMDQAQLHAALTIWSRRHRVRFDDLGQVSAKHPELCWRAYVESDLGQLLSELPQRLDLSLQRRYFSSPVEAARTVLIPVAVTSTVTSARSRVPIRAAANDLKPGRDPRAWPLS